MSIIVEPLFEKEHSCLVSDLVNGLPTSTDFELGSVLYAYDGATQELAYVFKLTNPSGVKTWYKVLALGGS